MPRRPLQGSPHPGHQQIPEQGMGFFSGDSDQLRKRKTHKYWSMDLPPPDTPIDITVSIHHSGKSFNQLFRASWCTGLTPQISLWNENTSQTKPKGIPGITVMMSPRITAALQALREPVSGGTTKGFMGVSSRKITGTARSSHVQTDVRER